MGMHSSHRADGPTPLACSTQGRYETLKSASALEHRELLLSREGQRMQAARILKLRRQLSELKPLQVHQSNQFINQINCFRRVNRSINQSNNSRYVNQSISQSSQPFQVRQAISQSIISKHPRFSIDQSPQTCSRCVEGVSDPSLLLPAPSRLLHHLLALTLAGDC